MDSMDIDQKYKMPEKPIIKARSSGRLLFELELREGFKSPKELDELEHGKKRKLLEDRINEISQDPRKRSKIKDLLDLLEKESALLQDDRLEI